MLSEFIWNNLRMACVGGGALLGTSYLYKSWNWTDYKSWNWMQIVSTGKCTNHRLTQATIGHCRWEWVLIIFTSLVWLLLVTLVWCCTPSLFYLGGQTELQMINTEIIQWRANHLSLDPPKRSVLATILLCRLPPKLSQIWTKLQFIMFLHSRSRELWSFWKLLLRREQSLVCVTHCVCHMCDQKTAQLARIRFVYVPRRNLWRYETRDCSLDKNQCSWLLALKLTEASPPSAEEDLHLPQSKVSLLLFSLPNQSKIRDECSSDFQNLIRSILEDALRTPNNIPQNDFKS